MTSISEVESVLDEFHRALAASDTETLARLTSDDLVYIHSSGLTEDKSAFLAAFDGTPFRVDVVSLDMRTLGGGESARVHARLHLVPDSGEIYDVRVLYVLERTGPSAWRIVSRQATRA